MHAHMYPPKAAVANPRRVGAPASWMSFCLWIRVTIINAQYHRRVLVPHRNPVGLYNAIITQKRAKTYEKIALLLLLLLNCNSYSCCCCVGVLTTHVRQTTKMNQVDTTLKTIVAIIVVIDQSRMVPASAGV